MWQWVNFIAAALGAIGGPAAIWSIYRERPRELTLNYEIESRAAFPEHRKPDATVPLEFAKQEIDNPYGVQLYLRPDGHADIKASDFGQSDVTLHVEAPVVAVLDQDSLDADSVTVDAKLGIVKIGPQVLKRGELVVLSLLVNGKPDPRLDAKLADVMVSTFDHTNYSKGRISRGVLYGVTSAAAVMLFLSGVLGYLAFQAADRQQSQLSELASETALAAGQARAALATDPQNIGAVKGILEQLGQTAQGFCKPPAGDFISSDLRLNLASPGGRPYCQIGETFGTVPPPKVGNTFQTPGLSVVPPPSVRTSEATLPTATNAPG